MTETPQPAVIDSIANEHLTVEVSRLGAELHTIKSADGREWLWNGDPAWWNGRAPILFPIVGRAPDNTITIDGEAFPMAQHGFARKRIFTRADDAADQVAHTLAADAESRAIYPFDFLLTLEHRLDGKALVITATVTNTDSRPILYGFGFHPAFSWPLPGGEGRPHVVTLGNGASPPLVGLEGGLIGPASLPTPFVDGRLALHHDLFLNDALIMPEGAGDSMTFAAENGPALAFRFENLPALALWQKPGAPYLCVEPWHGMAALAGAGSELAARPFNVTLPPGESARYAMTVDFSAAL